jgi:hypothetical protein
MIGNKVLISIPPVIMMQHTMKIAFWRSTNDIGKGAKSKNLEFWKYEILSNREGDQSGSSQFSRFPSSCFSLDAHLASLKERSGRSTKTRK